MSNKEPPALYAVVGHPVKHSLSPRIHTYWYNQLGLNASYQVLDLVSDHASADISALARAGFSGLNITLPHKLSALEASTRATDDARKIGAANTLVMREDDPGKRVWKAFNTDWTGFLWSLDRLCPHLPETAVLIGAGGAARGVAFALKKRGLKLTLLNRTPKSAESMADELGLYVSSIDGLDNLNAACKNQTLVINTISMGHDGGSLSLPSSDAGTFMDISYGEAARPTLESAQMAGWQTGDGLPMLIGQAADAFKLWFGVEPDREAALAACLDWTKTASSV